MVHLVVDRVGEEEPSSRTHGDAWLSFLLRWWGDTGWFWKAEWHIQTHSLQRLSVKRGQGDQTQRLSQQDPGEMARVWVKVGLMWTERTSQFWWVEMKPSSLLLLLSTAKRTLTKSEGIRCKYFCVVLYWYLNKTAPELNCALLFSTWCLLKDCSLFIVWFTPFTPRHLFIHPKSSGSLLAGSGDKQVHRAGIEWGTWYSGGVYRDLWDEPKNSQTVQQLIFTSLWN